VVDIVSLAKAKRCLRDRTSPVDYEAFARSMSHIILNDIPPIGLEFLECILRLAHGSPVPTSCRLRSALPDLSVRSRRTSL